jgi:hypothetical protein
MNRDFPLEPPAPVDQYADAYAYADHHEPDCGQHGLHTEREPEFDPTAPDVEKTDLPWFAFHNKVVTSMEYRKLAYGPRATLVDLMSYASRERTGGRIPSPDEITKVYNIPTRDAKKHYEELGASGLIYLGANGDLYLTNWEKQPKGRKREPGSSSAAHA